MAHTTLSGSSSAEPPDGSTVCVGIQFTETMRGHFSTAVLDDYQRADEKAKGRTTPPASSPSPSLPVI